MAAGLALVLVIGLAIAYSSERRRSDDLEAQLALAVDDQAVLTGAAAVSRDRIVALERQVGGLEQELERARRGRAVIEASRRETRGQLRSARDELDAERARFRSFMGPAIDDGTHVGRLVAVGADQEPPRIVADQVRWFIGPAATEAAIADGAIAAGQTVPRYIRNDEQSWRTVAIDPSAAVTLRRWNRVGTYTVSISELQRLSHSDAARARAIFHDPFSMTVAGGEVTSLRQLRYP
ncbi:MAG: hypothetical protein ACRDGK_00020 [Actinomycetota bacterium]